MPSVDQTYLLTHDRRVLSHWYLAAVGRGQRRLPPPATAFEPLVKKPVIPVSAKIVYVIRRLFSGVKVKYKSMFSSVKSKSEAVATFLAILELIRGGRIAIDQNDDLKMVGKEK
jgi:segregation and condensation protein A